MSREDEEKPRGKKKEAIWHLFHEQIYIKGINLSLRKGAVTQYFGIT